MRPRGLHQGADCNMWGMNVGRSLALGVVVLTAGSVLTGQQTQPVKPDSQMPPITFRAEINYVEVDAVVVDRQGNFVRNLRKEDFQIVEDGKPQTVTAFAYVDIPVVRAEQPLFAAQPVEPDVQSNTDSGGGRLYVLILDDLHTHPLRSMRVRREAKEFIDRNLGANDLAAVVHTSGREDAAQDFTNNKRRLDEAIDKFMGRKLRSATLEKVEPVQPDRRHVQPARSAGGGSVRAGTRLQRPQRDEHAQEPLELALGCPRPAQGGAGLQRRRRLRHHRSDQQPGSVDDHVRNAGRDRRGQPGQRQLLHHRSAGPPDHRRRKHRDDRLDTRGSVGRHFEDGLRR